MENLKAVAIFPKILPENLEQFKSIAQEMLLNISKQDSILSYEMYFTLDNSSCVVIEEYKTPEGAIEHVKTNSALLDKLTSLGGAIQGSMFPRSQQGEAINEIKNNWDSKMHVYFDGK